MNAPVTLARPAVAKTQLTEAVYALIDADNALGNALKSDCDGDVFRATEDRFITARETVMAALADIGIGPDMVRQMVCVL